MILRGMNSKMDTKQKLKYKHSIIVLDDEPGILKAVTRILRKLPCEALTTTDPNEALQMITEKKPPFSLIISDQRMPEMKGADFLKQAKKISQYSIRFLMTGYTDMDALVDAINKGGIHRFIAKPWDDDDLLKIIEDGLLQYELILENKRLMALVAKQNKELSSVNEMLEEKVKLRTEEITAKNEELNNTNEELVDSLYNTIRSIDTIIEIVDQDLSSHGQRVSEISIMLGQEIGMEMDELRMLEISALLHDIGRVGMENTGTDPEISFFTEQDQEASMFMDHTVKGQDMLKYIPQLEKCGDIIRSHHENYDGSGFPDGLEEKNIPVESRIISIANKYDKLHTNKEMMEQAIRNFLSAKQVARSSFSRVELIENSVMYYLQQNSFSLFDPDILKYMLDLIKNKKIPYKVEIEIEPRDLRAGDVVSQPVVTQSGKILFEKETLVGHRKAETFMETIAQDPLKTPVKIIENFGPEEE